MIVPTVRVKGGSKGSRIINASDFDPKIHQLADPPARHPLDHDGDGHKGGSLPEGVEDRILRLEADVAHVKALMRRNGWSKVDREIVE